MRDWDNICNGVSCVWTSRGCWCNILAQSNQGEDVMFEGFDLHCHFQTNQLTRDLEAGWVQLAVRLERH